jgi:hypothetical protein
MQTFATLFTTYLIYPVLTVVMVFFAAMMAKKNALLKNRRMITYTLLGMLVLAAPALMGFLDYDFMPWGYIASAVAYLIAGYFNDRWMLWVFKKVRDEDAKDEKERLKYRTRIIYTSIQIVLGVLVFAVLFNVCNELKYGIWAATAILPFALPSILRRSYDIFIHIQPLVYKIWNYGSCAGYATPPMPARFAGIGVLSNFVAYNK